ncbi:MAG: hypothetical protein IJY14_01780 [Acholeplasmatales bacterium]|nr:hypothetical protein [Acholeplasmatales bacterium]
MQNESIWADGCPENVLEEDKLQQMDLLRMGINFVIEKCLLPNGFKIEKVADKLNELPNIVAKRNNSIYGIAVVSSVFPTVLKLNDDIRVQYAKMCEEHKMIPLYAPVGFRSIDEARANASMTLKGDLFKTSFVGFIKLTTDPNQDVTIVPEHIYQFGKN